MAARAGLSTCRYPATESTCQSPRPALAEQSLGPPMCRPATKSKPAPTREFAAAMTRWRFSTWLMAVSLVLATIALYWPATSHDFVTFDDPEYVTANPHVQAGLNWEGIKWAFSNPVCWNWHPLTVLSHMVDCEFSGLNPWGHHFTNVLLHALNAMLVFALLQQMTGARWQSLLVAALFAVHPLRVESVAWVAERKDVLSGFFGLLSLLAYARYAQKSEVSNQCSVISSQASGAPAAHDRPRSMDDGSLITDHRSLFYLLSLFFFALGLMSKPMLVTWPFVMLLLDYWPLERIAERRSICSSGALVTGEDPVLCPRGVGERCDLRGAEARRLCDGGRKPAARRARRERPDLVLPLSGEAVLANGSGGFLSAPGHWPLEQVLLAGGLIVGITVLVFLQRRRYPFLLMGWLWFCGTLVPVIGLVQVGRTGDGGSIYLYSIAGGAGPGSLGRIRTDQRLALFT